MKLIKDSCYCPDEACALRMWDLHFLKHLLEQCIRKYISYSDLMTLLTDSSQCKLEPDGWSILFSRWTEAAESRKKQSMVFDVFNYTGLGNVNLVLKLYSQRFIKTVQLTVWVKHDHSSNRCQFLDRYYIAKGDWRAEKGEVPGNLWGPQILGLPRLLKVLLCFFVVECPFALEVSGFTTPHFTSSSPSLLTGLQLLEHSWKAGWREVF